jgi:hypothetical protein
MTYYIGGEVNEDGLVGGAPRYFYALRRTEQGDLYFTRSDQLIGTDDVIINNIGLSEDDFTEFEYGVDYFDGRLEEDHTRPNANMNFDQYRWDNKSIYYYLNAEGELVVRVNQTYNYPTDV